MERLQLGPLLGKGGFGEVRLGTLSTPGGLQRLVAVKLMHPGTKEEDLAVRRLRTEAKLLASLDHPTVVAVEDLVEIDGRLGLVMEYVPGADMMELLRDGQLPVRVALEALAQVADALHCAWRDQRIVHRDIKPHNIRLGPNGRVKLLDFGIAHAEEHTAHTAEGLIAGSAGHMAPERYEADLEDTPASDVYSLGCCLAAVLLNRPLWHGLTTHQQVALSLDPERHDRALARRLDHVEHPGLRGLLGQMLSYNHLDRPSAEVVAQALERAAATLPGPGLRSWARGREWPEVLEPAEPTGTMEAPRPVASEPRPSRPRGWMLAGATLLMALVLVAGLGLALLAWERPVQPVEPVQVVTPAPEPPQEPEAEPAEKPRAKPRAVKNPAVEPPPPEPSPEEAPVEEAPSPWTSTESPEVPSEPPSASPWRSTEATVEEPATPSSGGPVAVLVSTVPLGSPLTVDGRAVGPTPQTVELSPGRHTLRVSTSSGEHERVIVVGEGQDTRYIWRESAGAWSGSR